MTIIQTLHLFKNKLPLVLINLIGEYASQLEDSLWVPSFHPDQKYQTDLLTWNVNTYHSKYNNALDHYTMFPLHSLRVVIQSRMHFTIIDNAVMRRYFAFESEAGVSAVPYTLSKYAISYERNGFQEFADISFVGTFDSEGELDDVFSRGTIYRPYLADKKNHQTVITNTSSSWEGDLFTMWIDIDSSIDETNSIFAEWMFNEELQIWELLVFNEQAEEAEEALFQEFFEPEEYMMPELTMEDLRWEEPIPMNQL